ELENQTELSFINQVTPAKELKVKLLADIYQAFLFQHADSVECKNIESGPWVRCLIPSHLQERTEIKTTLTKLVKEHFLQIENVLEATKLSNYKLTVHLYKLEQRRQLELDMTMERAAGQL